MLLFGFELRFLAAGRPRVSQLLSKSPTPTAGATSQILCRNLHMPRLRYVNIFIMGLGLLLYAFFAVSTKLISSHACSVCRGHVQCAMRSVPHYMRNVPGLLHAEGNGKGST